MTSDILGTACFVHDIGVAVPGQALDCEQSAALLKDGCINPRSQRLLQRIVKLTGIERRHLAALDFQRGSSAGEGSLFRVAADQPHGPGMGARTAAFEKAAGPLILQALSEIPRATLARLDTLITATCTHAASPGLERAILAGTPVPAGVDRWNLGFMGCSAGLAGVRLVLRACSAHHQPAPAPSAARDHTALIVACELSSLHFQYTDELDQMTANLLFADGAAAMIVSTRPSRLRVVDARSVALPEFADQMVWLAGDHGLHLRLSQQLPETLAQHLPAAVDAFLSANRLARGDVRHWLVHPGGLQILDSVEQSLGLADGAIELSRSIYRRYGNMSSPTIFFILKELLVSRDASGVAVAMAFGPGLTIELVLIDLDPS